MEYVSEYGIINHGDNPINAIYNTAPNNFIDFLFVKFSIVFTIIIPAKSIKIISIITSTLYR